MNLQMWTQGRHKTMTHVGTQDSQKITEIIDIY